MDGMYVLFLMICAVTAKLTHGLDLLMQRQLTHKDYPGAVCNDGSPAVFYHQLSAPKSRQFLVHLQGGFFCQSPESCAERCTYQPYLCSSKTLQPTIYRSGIFSEQQKLNPGFAAFYKVFVHYCTSDMYIGNSEPTSENGGYFFKGRAHIKAVINSLKSLVNLGPGDLLVVSGTSAGGRGVLFNSDIFIEELPGVDVRFIVGAAIFYPQWEQQTPFSESCRSFNEIIHESASFWNSTVSDFDVNTWWKTFQSPLFIGEQTFDDYGFLYFCVDRGNPEHLRMWAHGMKAVTSSLLEDAPHVGLFLPGCFGHTMLRHKKWYSGVRVGPNKLAYKDVLANWLKGDGPIHAWDDCTDRPDDCNNMCDLEE